MKRKRFTEEQIIAVLKESEAGAKNQDLCRKHGITEQTFYRWRSKYGGMQISEAKRLREVETENRKLKQLLAEAHLDNAALKEVLSRNW
ncbi:MAG: transposase [Nitrospirales bacterium]|jgi:putative transposase